MYDINEIMWLDHYHHQDLMNLYHLRCLILPELKLLASPILKILS